ncbi:dynein axonemal intermediate chain 3 [Clarias gariepinus]|uniref:dynein axonemal intermediate chain 3 n=1 Tax=Clarias gariepinus TaxID=13013 RepID=UPI00234E0C15|nr:dynein axonemal intermediate chain 3 [Clarias gariepinus]
MSAKKPKSPVSKVKGKDKKSSASPSPEPSGRSSSRGKETEPAHPDHIRPLVLTSATQELFGCRADEDVTRENPYKLLRKADIVLDMRTRAAVSDFSPIKQTVLDYPEDEMLLVFDQDFTYGQVFYLVVTPEAKQSALFPPTVIEEEKDEDAEDVEVEKKSPEPRRWVSLGSEGEIEEMATDTRDPSLRHKVSRVRRAFGAPVVFTDLNALETKSAYTESASTQDKSFSIRKLQQERGTQAIVTTTDSSSQTTWKYPKNMWTQNEPQELTEEEREEILQSENLKNFLSFNAARFEVAIQQNNMMDMFEDELCVLEEGGVYEGKADTHLKVYQTFTELHYSKDKVISYISWHPTIRGVIAVSVTEQHSFEERINSSTKLLLNPALIMFWSFSNPIHPLLLLECPDHVLCFHFCPSHTSVIVGGCMNGQVALWDISGHVDRLQGTYTDKPTEMINTTYVGEKQHGDTPVVRYCAVSGIETGHRGPVTDVQWLPDSYEVSRSGIPLENKSQISVQVVSCSPDGCVMFWDLRTPHAVAASLTDKKHKDEVKTLENPQGVPDTFKHLDLSWKPLFKVTLPKTDTVGEYSPLKFSLRDMCCTTGVDRSEVPVFSALTVPSAKHLQHLDTISTKFYIGTEDGELVYTDWKLEKDNESGRLSSPKPTYVSQVHNSPVNTVLRSPFFKDIVLTVGSWTFAIWKEGDTQGPILHSAFSQSKRTAGFWSLTRPAVFFIGREDGGLEVWNLLEKTHEPVVDQNITTAPISCIKPWIASAKQHFLAVSDHLGTLHILQIPWTLRQPAPNEEQSMSSYLDREVERLSYFEKRPEAQERDWRLVEPEEKEMEKMEDNQMKELQMEVQKDYEEYAAMEKLMMKNMGLTKETQDTDNV